MRSEQGSEQALQLKEAPIYWIRHTSASMKIERGRKLKDMSEVLWHSSMATTDKIYVHSENKKRAESGKYRKI